MSISQTGDLSQQLFLRSQTAQIKTNLQRMTATMSSGLVQDVPSSLKGDTREWAGVVHSLKQSDIYAQGANFAANKLSAMQEQIEQADIHRQNIAEGLLTITPASTSSNIKFAGQTALIDFKDIISRVNANYSGDALFAGTEVSGAAIVNFSEFQNQIDILTAGHTTSDEIITTIDAWFDDPTGFQANIYLGDAGAALNARVASNKTVGLELNAAGQEFRNILKSGAIVSAAMSRGSEMRSTETAQLLRHGGVSAIAAGADIALLQAQVGVAEIQVEAGVAQNQANTIGLNIAQNAIVSADPYETATQLQAVQLQLEMHFAVTARLARLSLANYL